MESQKTDASPGEEEAPKNNSEEQSKDSKSESKTEAKSGTNSFNWRSRMITDEEPPEADILFKIADTPIIAKGNYTVITGQKKSRKSLVAADIMGKVVGKVLIFDTEQSHRHVWAFRDKVLKLKEDKAEVIVVYLRGLSLKEKKTFILCALNDNQDADVVMIDNIRDLLTDINNSRQAQKVSEFLEKLTSDYGIGLLVTIHSNKSDGKIRGHIGSELENKAFMVIQAERKPNDSSLITCESSRDGDFEPFSIRHHPITGMPEILNAGLNGEKKKEIFHEILKEGDLGYTDLLEKVKVAFANDDGDKLPELKAKALIRVATDQGWIIKIGKDRSPSAKYSMAKSDSDINSDINPNPSS